MKRLRNVLGGSLILLALAGLVVGTLVLLHTRERPTTAVAGPRPTPPEIPAPPTTLPAQGVLAALPPVEAGRLIQPPTVHSSKILYLTYEMSEKGGSHYHILDPQTGEETHLEFPPDQYSGSLELTMRASPTGERILYSVFFDFFNLEVNPAAKEIGSVWIMNPDGSDRQRLVGSDELSFPANAIWSPDGKEIAFLRLPDARAVETGTASAEHTEVWVMNADGSKQRKVADLPYAIDHIFGANPSMQWLLDDHIYIATGIVVEGDWLRINPRTGEVTRLMENVYPSGVQISPDTRWIIGKDAIVAALGRQPLHLPSGTAWDPTGARAAFVQFPPPYGDGSLEPGIWVRNLQNGGQIRLTALDPETASRCTRLSWSPDGRMLLCEDIEGLYVIWIDRDESQMVVRNPLAQEDVVGIKFIGWLPVTTTQSRP